MGFWKPAELLLQEAELDLHAMVSAISCDEHADRICVASHMSGPPTLIDFRDGSVRALPTVAPGGVDHTELSLLMNTLDVCFMRCRGRERGSLPGWQRARAAKRGRQVGLITQKSAF